MPPGRRFLLIASFPDSVMDFRGRLIESLVSQGMSMHLAVPKAAQSESAWKAIERAGVKIHSVPVRRSGVNPVNDFVYFWRLFSIIRRLKPNFVLSYTVKPVIYGSIAAYFGGVSNIFALVTGLGRALSSPNTGALPYIVIRLYRFALRRVTKVIFQNPDDQAFFEQRQILGRNTPSVVVNGSGIDVEAFSSKPLPEGPPSFLLIARLIGAKGIREYAGAAKAIRSTNRQIVFRLIGWIDDSPDAITEAELKAWSDAGNIEYLGRVEDVREAITGATVFALPSFYPEGTPRTILEALAIGRPIITTDTPGCRETVINGVNGFLVPPRSVSALVEAMRRFIDDPQLASQMSKRSRELAEEKYDVRKVNAVMLREMGIG